MSKVIDFNARDFRFDETCQSIDGDEVNAGTRAYVTLSFGNTEVWEIGDWGWTWSQIRRDIKLEKNTDYLFRFAMEDGVCDTDDAVTIAHIAPKRDWEDRYSYILDHNKFEPVICKRDGDGLLRIFELPFNTGEDEEWIIYLVAQHAVTKYFAPVDISLIEEMPDISYYEWWNERSSQIVPAWNEGHNSADFGLSDILRRKNKFAKLVALINSVTGLEAGDIFGNGGSDNTVFSDSNISTENCTIE